MGEAQVWDEGIDVAIKGAAFTADGGILDAKTDANGVAFIPEIQVHRPVDFRVAQGSLENPFWLAEPEGVSVVLRPGAPGHVDFPVISTGEIDGTVFKRIAGRSREVSDVVVQLLDADGAVVKETKSAFDGFYLLDFVKPGKYRVRLDPEQLSRLKLPPPPPYDITISGEGTISEGNDFVIGGSKKPTSLRVLLTSFNAYEFAELAWAGLVVEHSSVVAGLAPAIVAETLPPRGKDPERKIFHLFAGPLASREAAEKLCAGIRAARGGAWCNPVRTEAQ